MIPRSQQRELLEHLSREAEKLEKIFSGLRFKCSESIQRLVLAYHSDFKHFFEQGQLVKAFELASYVWGWLDALANLGLVEFPKEYRAWFKVEQP